MIDNSSESGTTETEATGEGEENVPQEADAPEMTLDEWKAHQSKSKMRSDFNIRKPNEGVDPRHWKYNVVLKKKQESESEEEDEEEDVRNLIRTDVCIDNRVMCLCSAELD